MRADYSFVVIPHTLQTMARSNGAFEVAEIGSARLLAVGEAGPKH